MLTRSERRAERARKVATSKRSIRLKKRLGRLAAKKFAHQEDSHTTTLMESYILRRKEERRKEREMTGHSASEQNMSCNENATNDAPSQHSTQPRQDCNISPSASNNSKRPVSHVQGSGRDEKNHAGLKARAINVNADRAGSRRPNERDTRLRTRSLY